MQLLLKENYFKMMQLNKLTLTKKQPLLHKLKLQTQQLLTVMLLPKRHLKLQKLQLRLQHNQPHLQQLQRKLKSKKLNNLPLIRRQLWKKGILNHRQKNGLKSRQLQSKKRVNKNLQPRKMAQLKHHPLKMFKPQHRLLVRQLKQALED